MASQSPLALSAADAAACGLFPAAAASAFAPASAAADDGFPSDAPVVDALGQVATAASLRAQLLRVYAASGGAPTPAPVTEAALRVDVELELLRRRCFAARNAQWSYATPVSAFDWRAADDAAVRAARWHPALVANVSVAVRRLRHDAAAEPRDDKDALSGGTAVATATASALIPPRGKKDERGAALGAFSRERAWPPREFSARAAAKPPKPRGGKRKAPAAVMEERSIFSKLCAECGAQSSPLWRKLPRDASARGPPAKPPAAAAAEGPADGAAPPPVPPSVPMADVCLACFLKLQRGDLFARKKAERERQARERKERAAAERLAEKKRLKQLAQQLKKQQQQHAKSRKPPVADEPVAVAAAAVSVVVLKTDAATPAQPPREWQRDDDEDEEADDEQVAPAEDEARVERRSVKRDRKKSKKDKKKKKKKRKRAADSESDGDDRTPLPSPPQLSGQYEYADLGGSRRARAARLPVTSFDDVDAEYEDEPVRPPPAASDKDDDAPRRSRKAAGRSASASVPPVTPAASSSSRKRRNSVVAAAVVIPDEPMKLSSRAARARTPISTATGEEPLPPTHVATAAASSAVSGALSARKRARKKPELTRERELRALGQYCPVCNAVYEEDDESTFVCCDSCEMWVHGSCDSTLTAASIAALSESSDKYICPMCGG